MLPTLQHLLSTVLAPKYTVLHHTGLIVCRRIFDDAEHGTAKRLLRSTALFPRMSLANITADIWRPSRAEHSNVASNHSGRFSVSETVQSKIWRVTSQQPCCTSDANVSSFFAYPTSIKFGVHHATHSFIIIKHVHMK